MLKYKHGINGANHAWYKLEQVAKKLAVDGVAGEGTGGSIALINPGDCLILFGAAVGCFEGIGLVLPIEVMEGIGLDLKGMVSRGTAVNPYR